MQYQITSVIGSGTYCSVHNIAREPDLVAKVYTCKPGEFCIDEDVVIRELVILQRLKGHPNIASMHDVVMDPCRVVLVMPRYPGTFVAETYVNQPQKRRAIAQQVLHAVRFMHDQGIIHRDLKPCNILLSNEGHAVVCDFNLSIQQGIAITDDNTYEISASTLWWRAPEVLLTDTVYDCGVDVWSVGVILLTMCMGVHPMKSGSDIGQLFLTYKVLGTPGSANIWPEAKAMTHYSDAHPQWNRPALPGMIQGLSAAEQDILKHMVAYPRQRKTAGWLMKHPYFQNSEQKT
jgi:serine/threonine protein kinase